MDENNRPLCLTDISKYKKERYHIKLEINFDLSQILWIVLNFFYKMFIEMIWYTAS